MKPYILGLVFAAAVVFPPLTHADTEYVPIGNPYTDTISLWSEIATALSSLANDFAALFNGSDLSASYQASAPQTGARSQAAAVVLTESSQKPRLSITYTVESGDTLSGLAQSYGISLASLLAANDLTQQALLHPGETLTIPNPQTASADASSDANPDQTTLSQNVKSVGLSSASSDPTNVIKAGPTFNLDNFVTQAELATALLALSTPPSGSYKPSPTSTTIVPLADGNPIIPYAAENNITNLSNVTISNANLTASEIPALNYFPATDTVSVAYGGTGVSNAPIYGQLLLGNGNGGYTLTATSSLGIVSGSSLLSSGNAWSALNVFAGGASTTNLSNFGTAYFGGTATTTIDGAGDLSVAGNTSLQNATSTTFYATSATFPTLSATWATLTNATSTNFFASNLTGDIEPIGGTTFSSLDSVLGRIITPADFGAVGDTKRVQCTVTTNSGSPVLTVSGCSFSSSDVGKYIVVEGAGVASASLATTIIGFTSATQITLATDAQENLSTQSEYVTWGHDDSAAINDALAAQAADGSSNTGACVFLPPAPNGYWGVASPINLDPNGLPSCLRGAGMYQSQILALASIAEVAYKNTSFVRGGETEDVGFDGNTVASSTVYLACADEMNFSNALFSNAGSNADLVLGDNVTNGCNTDQFNSDVAENLATYYPNASALPPYNVYVNTTDSYFNDMECINASNSNFYTNSNSYNTYISNVHCWGASGYYANYTFNINSSAHLLNPTVDGVNTVGVMINAGDVDLTGGFFENPESTSTTIGVEIAPNVSDVTVTGFDYQQKLSNASNIVVAETPIGSNINIFGNPGVTSYNIMAFNYASTSADNLALGTSLTALTTGSANTIIGQNSDSVLTTGVDNVLLGFGAGKNFTNQNSNVAIGYNALTSETNGGSSNDVAVGNQAGTKNTTGAGDVFVGSLAGYADTSGANNTFIGNGAASTTATGGNNIVIGSGNGSGLDLPQTNGSNQLDIGNLIYGTSISGSLTTVSTGDISIGTTSPSSRLSVWGPDAASSTPAFNVISGASTTVFSVFDGGNAELSGSLSQSSDERLKTNIQSLNASSSLSFIDALNPVAFNWIDPEKGATLQLGFIAQQVEEVFPNLVSTTSPTSLTPDGTLSLNYIGLISPIVSASQALSTELASLENTIAGFAQSFTSAVGNFGQVNAQNELCVGSTCVTPEQFQAMVAAASASQSSAQGGDGQSSDDTEATDTPPEIQINGDNPAIVQVGATYNDLGASITGPQHDLNLGITTFVNGAAMSPVQIDTSQAATDTIAYVVADQNGLISTSTRTVIIQAPSIAPSDDASSTPNATTTVATSTSS